MLNKKTESRQVIPVLAMVLIAALATSGPAMAAEKQEPPQTTTDGLNLVKSTKSRIVYLADGAEFDQYTKVLIVGCFVAFEKNWQRDYNRDVVGLDGRVTDKDVTRIKEGLSAEFKKEFTKVMTENGHEVVTEPASDVLILRPAILNLVVNAPDVRSASRSRTYVADLSCTFARSPKPLVALGIPLIATWLQAPYSPNVCFHLWSQKDRAPEQVPGLFVRAGYCETLRFDPVWPGQSDYLPLPIEISPR